MTIQSKVFHYFPKSKGKPKVKLSDTHKIKEVLRKYKLNSVCEESYCPNISECFGIEKTVTFLLLGNLCTRHCSYCGIKISKKPPLPDPAEPRNLRMAIEELGIKYAVLTSVNRDDIEDGGASHLAECIKSIKDICKVEILSPDFKYDLRNLDILLEAKPDVFAHNIETVERLYPKARPKGDYGKSLYILKYASQKNFITKTSLIVGLGETYPEVERTIYEIRETGCNIITVGQYFQPSLKSNINSYPVDSEIWYKIEELCNKLGFDAYFIGPQVRSSYLADKILKSLKI